MSSDKYTIEEKKWRYRNGFGYRISQIVDENKEVIKGLNIYMFGKQVMTIGYSKSNWLDDGKPIKFQISNGTLFIKKLAITMR